MKRTVSLILCLLFLSLPLLSCQMPKEEKNDVPETTLPEDAVFDTSLRGVWVASVGNLNFPSRKGLSKEKLAAELDEILNISSSCGINAVFLQVRPACDALYRSEIFPTSLYLSGEQGKAADGDFDPLAYIIERASPLGIDIYAWVNPLRVSYGSAKYPAHDISALSSDNPAREHPEWTVAYGDGKLYFDPAYPEVRALVASGVAEIVKNYDVKGIVFDDYFYPYPVNGASFDDDESYSRFGGGMELEDWRRENVNLLVKQSYDAIKAADRSCLFGVSPFGIWQNDNGANGGSDTNGLEAYRSIYCDALAWAEGGYVDFISPQIYWSFDKQSAPFETLAKWWEEKLKDSGVGYYISHAAYKIKEWNSAQELIDQLELAGELEYCHGSVLYSYAALKENHLSVREALAALAEGEDTASE